MQMMYIILKKALAKWNCSLHFHITSASPFLQRTHSQSEKWNRIPVCRKFNVQIPSRRRTNEQKKQARGGRSCAGDEGQGRAGVSRLCGAPASHRGAWTVLGTTKPWPVRGPGIRAALKWLPALRLPEEGCSKPRTDCPPRLPCRQGASASQQQARRGQGAPHLGLRPSPRRGDLRLHLTLQKVTPAPPFSAQHVQLGIAMATSPHAPPPLLNSWDTERLSTCYCAS